MLSVDYPLAPDAKFPVQLDECYQVYRWAILNALRIGMYGTPPGPASPPLTQPAFSAADVQGHLPSA